MVCFIGAVILWAGHSSADPITDLYDTGVGSNGVALPDGTSPDPHYTIVAGSDGSAPNTTNIYDSGFWMPGSSSSAWVTPGASFQYFQNGPFDYQTTFTLPPDTNSVSISLNLAADDEAPGILLNGVLVDTPPTVYTFDYTAVSFNSDDVIPGLNTLTFETLNFDPNGGNSPTGLRVDGITGSYTVVPESSAFALLGAGMFGLMAGRGSRNRLGGWF
jgi:hypothetical protein